MKKIFFKEINIFNRLGEDTGKLFGIKIDIKEKKLTV
jgi:hypothetical protein